MLKRRLLPSCLVLVLAACATEKPLRHPPVVEASRGNPSSAGHAVAAPTSATRSAPAAAARSMAAAAPGQPAAESAAVSASPAAAPPGASAGRGESPMPPPAVAQASTLVADGSHVPAVQMLLATAQAQVNVGDLDKAAISLERAQRLAPQSALVYQRLADVRLRQRRPAEAEQLLRRALSLAGNPAQQAQILRELAVAEQRQGESSAAQDALSRAAALQPLTP